MPSVSEVWPVLKEILETGVIGAVAVLMIFIWLKKDKELRSEKDARLEDSKEHKKELLKLQAEYNREVTSIVHQYDKTVSSVALLMDRVEERLSDQ